MPKYIEPIPPSPFKLQSVLDGTINRRTTLSQEIQMSKANSVQHGGDHYKNKAIQPWDYITSNGLGYLEGNAVKYLSRWREKNGVADLKKAIHYIEKLIEIEESNKTNPYLEEALKPEEATIHPCGVLKDGTVVGVNSDTGKLVSINGNPLPPIGQSTNWDAGTSPLEDVRKAISQCLANQGSTVVPSGIQYDQYGGIK